MNQSRYEGRNYCSMLDLKELIQYVNSILNRIADKNDRLIDNITTNLAENRMVIRSKIDGGKVINRCGRGSWHTRCFRGALRKNLGVIWSPVTFQTVTGTNAGTHLILSAKRQSKKKKKKKKNQRPK